MKKILTIIAVLCFGLSGYGQGMKLFIKDLQTPKKVAQLNITAAELITEETGGRVNATVSYYLITRNQDAKSPLIVDAINRGRAFRSGGLKIPINADQISRHVFSQLYLSDYSSSSSQGQLSTETFRVYFESEDVEILD